MNKSLYLLFVLLAGSLSPASAQTQIKIHGHLFDEKRHPIEGVSVQRSQSSLGTATDGRGYFELTVPAADTTHLLFSYLGYEKTARTFPPSKRDYSVDVTLRPVTNALEDVTVTEQRRQTGSMQRVDVNNSRLVSDASGGSIESLLVTFAGVNSSNELSSQYSVRGGNFDENIVYINGIEVYRPLLVRTGQQEGLSIINPDMVQEVTFSSGGYDAQYGDKMASVLDIIYKKPTQFEAAVSASLMGASGYVGHATRKTTQLYGIRFKKNNSLLGTLQEKGEYDPSYLDFQTYVTWDIAPRWELTFLGNLSQNSYKFEPKERSTQFGNYLNAKKFKVYFDGKEEDLFQTLTGAATINYRATEKTVMSLTTSIFGTNEKETYDITGQYWLSELDIDGGEGETSGIGTYHEHARNYLQASVFKTELRGETLLRKHRVNWGASVQQERIQDRMRQWEMRDSAGYSLPSTGDKVNLFYNLSSHQNINTTRLQAYVQESYRWTDRIGIWGVTGGVRAA